MVEWFEADAYQVPPRETRGSQAAWALAGVSQKGRPSEYFLLRLELWGPGNERERVRVFVSGRVQSRGDGWTINVEAKMNVNK